MQLQSVVEEECTGNGTLQCVLSAITAAFRPDAALVTEPFPGAITVSQIGVLWFHIDIAGAPAHVGEAGEGVNAIEAAFPILAALHRLEAELNEAPPAPYDEIDVDPRARAGLLQDAVMATALTFEAILRDTGLEVAFPPAFEKHWPRYRAWFLHEARRPGPPTRPRSRRCATTCRSSSRPTNGCASSPGEATSRRASSQCGSRRRTSPAARRGSGEPAPRPSSRGTTTTRPSDSRAPSSTPAGTRPVIGMSDCVWGLLDGANDAGLAISLAFGGRKVVGSGFGVLLVVRYLLETCETSEDARDTLRRLRYHLAHTLTIVDRSGDVTTAFLAPDRDLELSPAVVATNHLREVKWAEHVQATHTLERELTRLLDSDGTTADALVAAFLRPPLLQRDYARGMGTLYTAAYRGAEGRADYFWPGIEWRQSFDRFQPGTRTICLVESTAA